MTIVIVCFFLASTGHADPLTGNGLVTEMEEYKKASLAKSDSDANFILATSFASYVYAVYDIILLYKKICPVENVTKNQVTAVVIQWIENHPKRWHEPAAVLISQALREGFAC